MTPHESRGESSHVALPALAIVTRDRADLFERFALPSLAASPDDAQVVVVDQSAGDDTRDLVSHRPNVIYVRSEAGLSRGRNTALTATTTPVLAFTDDDVSFPPTWLASIAALFARHPDAGAVCGRGRTPAGVLLPGSPPGIYRGRAHPFGLGSGFNFGVRRTAVEQVGPFDEQLGAGAEFRAGEDTDMLYRLLRAGWSVVCSDEITVVHHDWRHASAERSLHYGYGVGAGAQTVGHVVNGDRRAAIVGLREAVSHVGWIPRSLVRLRFRVAALQVAFLAGMLAGAVGRWRALRSQPAMRA